MPGILLVEDDEGVRPILQHTLISAGHDVDACSEFGVDNAQLGEKLGSGHEDNLAASTSSNGRCQCRQVRPGLRFLRSRSAMARGVRRGMGMAGYLI